MSELRTYLRNVPSSLLQLPNHLSDRHLISSELKERSPSRDYLHLSTVSTPDIDRSDQISSSLQEEPEIKDVTTMLSPPHFPPPSPIIPLLTPEPRSLSNFLLSFTPSESPDSRNVLEVVKGPVTIHTKPIFPPTVPPETSRVRVCIHAGHSRQDVDILLQGIIAWIEHRMGEMRCKQQEWERMVLDSGVRTWMEAKL